MHTSKGVILLLACAAQFMVVLDVAIVGALTAAIAFPWRATRKTEPAPRRGVGSVPASG
jgi:hypothetical protein